MKFPPAAALLAALTLLAPLARAADFPAVPADTGVSGVYEVMVGTDDAQAVIKHFQLFGFRVIEEASMDAPRAAKLYGVNSALRSWRMQNANIDAHGLLRVLQWDKLLPGVGYARPDTPGQRMAVLRTSDIFRIVDVFRDDKEAGNPWLVQDPILDTIYQDDTKSPTLFHRRVGVRETAIWGEWFNHIFFQRYGYDLPGYGYINQDSVFRTSEFTHHDFIMDKPLEETVGYYVTALGFRPEQKAPVIDGYWQKGAASVFNMPPGHSHQYIGMVSPNNISGKLKFFRPYDHIPISRMDRVAANAKGINIHSLYVRNLQQVRRLLAREDIATSDIMNNEFGEKSMVFTGPDGAIWQILELRRPPRTKPVKVFKLVDVNH